MNALDEAMDDKMERLEHENEQLRADKQECMDALAPFVTGAWVPLQTLKFAKKVHDKHYESMT